MIMVLRELLLWWENNGWAPGYQQQSRVLACALHVLSARRTDNAKLTTHSANQANVWSAKNLNVVS